LQVKIWDDRKAAPLSILKPHDGQAVCSVAFLTAPEHPNHINLITAVWFLQNIFWTCAFLSVNLFLMRLKWSIQHLESSIALTNRWVPMYQCYIQPISDINLPVCWILFLSQLKVSLCTCYTSLWNPDRKLAASNYSESLTACGWIIRKMRWYVKVFFLGVTFSKYNTFM
jgi:hypothetical protein